MFLSLWQIWGDNLYPFDFAKYLFACFLRSSLGEAGQGKVSSISAGWVHLCAGGRGWERMGKRGNVYWDSCPAVWQVCPRNLSCQLCKTRNLWWGGDGGGVTCRESALTVSRGEGRMLWLGVVVTKAAGWPQWPPALIHISEKTLLRPRCCTGWANTPGAGAKNFHFWCHDNGQMEEHLCSFSAKGQLPCSNWNPWSSLKVFISPETGNTAPPTHTWKIQAYLLGTSQTIQSFCKLCYVPVFSCQPPSTTSELVGQMQPNSTKQQRSQSF